MKKSSLLFLAGILSITGCVAGRQSTPKSAQPAAAQKANSGGLDFLADIPSLKAVSLKMSESKLVGILHRQKLEYQREMLAGQPVYLVKPKAHVVVVFGFQDGRCSGIQRLPD